MGSRSLQSGLLLASLFASGAAHGATWSYRVVAGELTDVRNRWVAGDAGAVVELDGKVVVRLRSNSVVRADRKVRLLALDTAAKVKTYGFDLESGAVDVEAPEPTRKDRQAVMIRAPKEFSATTQGGSLEVATVPGRSAAANKAGVAWVGTSDGWHSLKPGTAYSSSKLVVSPYPLTASPELAATEHAFNGITGPARIDGLRWSAVDTAAHYVVRLGSPGELEPLEIQQSDTTNEPRPFRGVAPGNYEATVSAIDANGIEGARSAPVALRVVGVELPPGSVIADDGSIGLVEHDTATLIHMDGLVASYGQAQGWVVAPTSMSLFRGDTTVVRIRGAHDKQGFSVTFSPRRLALRVNAGPKTVRWPSDPVEITIDPNDRSGPLPEALEVRPVVTVGIDPVSVEFHRDGTHLRATLPPQSGAGRGPWVVRVDVTDQFGHFLGRDFVEVGVSVPKPKTLTAPVGNVGATFSCRKVKCAGPAGSPTHASLAERDLFRQD